MKTLAVIPARYSSTRLPGKPLVEIAGVPLVLRVLNNVRSCPSVDRVIVATDDERIAEVVARGGGEALMTPSELPSGGDRVAYAAKRIEADYVLNVQVDDPLVGADMIDSLVAALDADRSVMLALLVKRIENSEEVAAPNVVKAVFDGGGRAMYFSRSPIPYPRNEGGVWYKHIGPYGWRRDFLLEFAAMEQTPLEKAESLEMLRVIERGRSIKCVEAARDTIEIDTPEDLTRIEKYFRRGF
ncbi:3-deoxy-manno-octulosonate cytidylyltransferase [Synergistes jonesii]|uniref:3-deoxy-manno-octulosonate cytidylyltransferase n=1 Tax=Synergistes jonesii TaxID=2754 RepID=A0A073IRD6_9BACT|nr:3-deoxy-manno-octulosonate cytidylyltransferase [Synergistes jonesii]KEJ92349.1 3-deoxy-manno-octulosonate cytidylyltransferase [Synergistes jonesii]OFB62793.1 3-deoxy-manno-octulosonate cytidylyltransferase [Synergistes jonesii]OFB63500.1 3-deoxy-manno-octulosonate cytidylyltransferase [Synergistes jonesii]OFB65457.1 3-deoxy-manno-octulosonate cytidylyltransferase [Synergistes jonesii]OFB67738.1 3-deoxy-manno-octulosonate cytidylyltransferase [Synergistes jonesii]